jgi:hypothetical protein
MSTSEIIISQDADRLLLGNQYIETSFSISSTLALTSIINKLTGHTIKFNETSTCVLALATSNQRIDITGWQFCPGASDPVDHEQEQGHQNGYNLPDTDTDGWIFVGNLNDFPIGAVAHSTVVYPGYAWYCSKVTLPDTAPGEAIHLVLGGTDHQDWGEYWLYINGIFIGHAAPSGTWHPAPAYIITPDMPAYAALKFGDENVIAVQVKGLDRRFAGMQVSDAERYSVGSLLVDQYLSVGPAQQVIDNFKLVSHDIKSDANTAELILHYQHDTEPYSLCIRYWLAADDTALNKQITVTNQSDQEQILLEIILHQAALDTLVSPGGFGQPCLVGADAFCGVRHPAGVAQSDGSNIYLAAFPGRHLAPGASYESKVAIFGVGAPGTAFADYIARHGRRSDQLLRMFHCYGIHDIASTEEPTHLTEAMVLDNLNVLADFKTRGIHFNYYWIDAGWSNPRGDLRDFNPDDFPTGPDHIIQRVKELDMKFGLWTSPAGGPMAFYPGVENPIFTAPGAICMAEGAWKDTYRDALLYHVRKNGVKGFKFDGNAFVCNCPEHTHLPNKYSIEPLVDGFIAVLDAVRAACHDVFYMFYWNVQSPWWLLHGDTIYERGVLMEGSTAADAPTPILRQSITLSFDQAAHHAWPVIPPRASDSLGVWISRWRWANYILKEGWQDAWVMDIARANMLCQLWGDVSVFDDNDIRFFAHISAWVDANWPLLRHPKRILGDPWLAQPYGYAFSDGASAAVFICNPQFEPVAITLDIVDDLALPVNNALKTYSIYPDAQTFGVTDNSFILHLAPFEVRLLHIDTQRPNGLPAAFEPFAIPEPESTVLDCQLIAGAAEQLSWDNENARHFIRRAVNGRVQYIDQHDSFTPDPRYTEARDLAIVHHTFNGTAQLSAPGDVQSLLVIVQLSRNGIYWHHQCLYDIVKLTATVGEHQLAITSLPYRWHEEAGGWSWIHFRIPIPVENAADYIDLRLDTYLPADVDAEITMRVFNK